MVEIELMAFQFVLLKPNGQQIIAGSGYKGITGGKMLLSTIEKQSVPEIQGQAQLVPAAILKRIYVEPIVFPFHFSIQNIGSLIVKM
jgi:hypothetical protein